MLRPYFAILFSIILTSSGVLAQDVEREEWAEIDAKLDRVKENLDDHPAKYKPLIDSCLKLSIRYNYQEGEGEAKKYLGNYYSLKGEHVLGRKNIVIGLRIMERAGVPELTLAEGELDIGNTWFREGKYDNAMRKYIDAMRVFETYQDSSKLLKGYANISQVYLAREQNQKAEGYLKDMLLMAEALQNRKEIAHANNLLGRLFQSKGNLEKARFYFKTALDINLQINNTSGIAHGYNNLAILNYYEGKLDHAITYFKRALDKRLTIDNPIPIAESYRNIGSLYFFEKEYKQAIEYFQKSLKVASEGNALNDVAIAHEYISNAYENMGKSDSALQYYKAFNQMEDSIALQDKEELVADLEFKYQNESLKRKNEQLDHEKSIKQLKIEKLNEQKSYDQFKIIALSLCFVLLLALLIYIGYSLSVKNKLNRSLEQQKNQLEKKNEIIELKNEEIMSSIDYAQNLQQSLLPEKEAFSKIFSETCLFFSPKDIVSGDFYWKHETKDSIYFAVGDCTGHGVPGAMLSVMSINILNAMVRTNQGLTPNKILDQLNEEFVNSLYRSHQKRMDGLDISICQYIPARNKVLFSGAVNSLLVELDGEFQEIKSERRSIGGMTDESTSFKLHEIDVKKGDALFLYTDGYQDQFGGANGKKFRRQNFRKLIKKIIPLSHTTQEQILEETLVEWQGGYEQVDDILVLGVKV